MTDFGFYAAQIIDGIAYGSIYGIFALSIVLLFRANKLVNFAQAEIANFLVIIATLLLNRFSYFTTIALVLALSFVAGSLLHVGVMRFITEKRQVLHSNETVLTIGFFTVFNSLSAYIHGDEPQPFPSAFGNGSFAIIGINISYHSAGILVSSTLMALAIYCCFKFTRIGTVFEAVAENIVAARLRGIWASNIIALAWGFTAMLSAAGALLVAPVLYVTPNMLENIFGYSLIAVIIGGLESPLGALVGGIIVGVVENLASNFQPIGSELKFCAVMLVLFLILIMKPRGLWGRAEARRV